MGAQAPSANLFTTLELSPSSLGGEARARMRVSDGGEGEKWGLSLLRDDLYGVGNVKTFPRHFFPARARPFMPRQNAHVELGAGAKAKLVASMGAPF